MVLDKIRELVANQFLVEPESVSASTAFVEDLGADSLDVVELTMAIEEEFGLEETSEEVLSSIVTVGDLADYVTRAQA